MKKTTLLIVIVIFGVAVLLLVASFLGFGKGSESILSENNSVLIRVTNPLKNSTIKSPLVVTGEARGTWYFEASFPVVLVDWDGKIIADGIAMAQDEWMTENLVPFRAELFFNTSDISQNYSNKGTLILKKDNPSGLSQFDRALEVPVLLK